MEPTTEQGIVAVDDATGAPPRLPPMGTLGALAPLHLSTFAIETNVSRIATQIAEGRTPTYD
jgi:hypothetical protein